MRSPACARTCSPPRWRRCWRRRRRWATRPSASSRCSTTPTSSCQVLTTPRARQVQLTQGNYVPLFLESQHRDVRRAAFEAMLGTYRAYRNTLAATLAAQVKRDLFFARAHHYAHRAGGRARPAQHPHQRLRQPGHDGGREPGRAASLPAPAQAPAGAGRAAHVRPVRADGA